MVIAILFTLGLFLGSFLNVVIDRLPRNENFIVGHSHCDYCKHLLAWYDLVPLFSWVFLQGRCRYCKKWIGWKYPLIELTTGLACGLISVFYQASFIVLLFQLLIISGFIMLFYIDLWNGILPDEILLFLLVVIIALQIFTHTFSWNTMISAVVASVLFLVLFLTTAGRGMGMGDIKLAFIMGLFLGFPRILIALYAAFLTGAIVGIILVLYKKKKFFGGTIAFGPFLIGGLYFAFFLGQFLWNSILRSFF